jgi:hypothetical protein
MVTSISLLRTGLFSLLSGHIVWGVTPLILFSNLTTGVDTQSPVTYLYGGSLASPIGSVKSAVPNGSLYVRYNAGYSRVELCTTGLPYVSGISHTGTTTAYLGQQVTNFEGLVFRPLIKFNLDFSSNNYVADTMYILTPATDDVLAYI